jgi:hypothetical protein
MHVPEVDGVTPFQKVIETAISFLKSKIISSEADLLGIVLYGTVGFN